jgi:hypothetical protein
MRTVGSYFLPNKQYRLNILYLFIFSCNTNLNLHLRDTKILKQFKEDLRKDMHYKYFSNLLFFFKDLSRFLNQRIGYA